MLSELHFFKVSVSSVPQPNTACVCPIISSEYLTLAPGIFHTKSLTPSRDKTARHKLLIDNGFGITSIDEEGALNDALAVVESDNATKAPTAAAPVDDNTAPAGLAGKQDNAVSNGAAFMSADAGEAANVPAQPEVLPAVSPEEQYRFALGRALQNDLETAQLAFSEFRKFNKGHEREVDSIFWLGRVYFMRGEFEKAAMTFSEFNSAFPGDARLVDTTMWIAESVSHFAPPAQACEIYASLPQLIDTPPDTFLAQLSKLSDDANCSN